MELLPRTTGKPRLFKTYVILSATIVLALVLGLYFFRAYGSGNIFNRNSNSFAAGGGDSLKIKDSLAVSLEPPVLDTLKYDQLLQFLNNGDTSGRWPVKIQYPLAGAILPFNRIVAYYGNLYSKKMGVLGEYPADEMLKKLEDETRKWQAADSSITVRPALHYIAVTAQGYPGKGNTYRLRMPFKQIDSVIRMAARINALVFLDVQVGLSTLQSEIPQLETYLKMPQVHLGIDPEFSMKTGKKPGSVIGTMDADDINYTIGYLENLVKSYL